MTNRLLDGEFLSQLRPCQKEVGDVLPALIEQHSLAVVVGALRKLASDRLLACRAAGLCNDEEAVGAVERMRWVRTAQLPR